MNTRRKCMEPDEWKRFTEGVQSDRRLGSVLNSKFLLCFGFASLAVMRRQQ